MKIAIIGCGKLGLPCAEIMAEQHEVLGYDINKPLVSSPVKFVDTVVEAATDRDMIFVAVPTPHEKGYDGRSETSWLEPKNFDYTIVESVLREINEHINQNTLVVLISTVLPGTVRKHFAPLITRGRFIYNPYLIAMGSVKWDMIHPECLIIGTEDGSETGDAKLLVDFYRPLMKNDPPINIGTWEEAESIKIFYNTWISAKIGLVNMIQDVAESLGHMNVDVVTDALKRATQRITGPKYMTAGMGDGGACFTPDTLIISDKGMVPISELSVGDKVLSQSGDFNLVKKIYKNKHSANGEKYNGTILEIKSEGGLKTRITPTHNVYYSKDTRKTYITNGKTKFVNSNATLDTKTDAIRVKQAFELLKNYDYLVTPLMKKQDFTLPSHYSDEYIELGGYYISEGSIDKTRVCFSLHIDEKDIAERISYLIKKIYGEKANVIIQDREISHGKMVRYNNPELCKNLSRDFGVLCTNKFLPPEILYGDLQKTKYVLKGIFQGDGTTNKSGFALSTTSVKLAYGVQFLLNRFEIISTINSYAPRVGKDGVYHKEAYEVRIRNAKYIKHFSNLVEMNCYHQLQDKRYTRCFVKENFLYRKTREIKEINYNGDVYTLEVENDHNYVVPFGMVENCHPRDNIALRWLAKELNLGYDLFKAIMESREHQAYNLAMKLRTLAEENGLPIIIHGRAYKPDVPYLDGSYSELVGEYARGTEFLPIIPVMYSDPMTGDLVADDSVGVILLAHNKMITYGDGKQGWYFKPGKGSIIVDPWRQLGDVPGCKVIHYGNTRSRIQP